MIMMRLSKVLLYVDGTKRECLLVVDDVDDDDDGKGAFPFHVYIYIYIRTGLNG